MDTSDSIVARGSRSSLADNLSNACDDSGTGTSEVEMGWERTCFPLRSPLDSATPSMWLLKFWKAIQLLFFFLFNSTSSFIQRILGSSIHTYLQLQVSFDLFKGTPAFWRAPPDSMDLYLPAFRNPVQVPFHFALFPFRTEERWRWGWVTYFMGSCNNNKTSAMELGCWLVGGFRVYVPPSRDDVCWKQEMFVLCHAHQMP